MFRRYFLITLIAISMVLSSVVTAYAAGITIPSGSTINVNTGTLDVPGDININTGGTLQGTTGTIRLSGDWTNSGTFSFDSGVTYQTTVVFYNSAVSSTISTISGTTTTFYNLTCTTAGKTLLFNVEVPPNNYRTEITNNLILTGDASTDITLNRSNGSGSDIWAIYPMNTWTVTDVVVSYSVNLNSTCINPGGTSSEGVGDEGTTINWFLPPTLVKLISFYAIGYYNKVVINWETASEYNNAGFNLYVSENRGGPYTKLNSALISGLGNSFQGKGYSYADFNVTDGKTYYYKLEDVEFSGARRMRGPVEAHPGRDIDKDNLTDDWERYYHLNPNDPRDASLDPDGDGLTNLEEFLQGTDPTAPEPAQPEPEGIRIISTDEYSITLELSTSTFTAANKEINGITYQELKIPGYIHDYTDRPGRPKMPFKPALLGIPLDANCRIQDLDFELVELSDYNIEPVLPYRLQEDWKEDASFGIGFNLRHPPKIISDTKDLDLSFYFQDEYYPDDIASVSYVGDLRGRRIACINIYPLSFNPARRQMRFYKRIRFKVAFEKEGEKPPDTKPPASHQGVSLKLYTKKEGLHRITWQELYNTGLDELLWQDPRKLKLKTQGAEIPIRIIKEEDGVFNYADYIEFYAQDNNSKYSSENVYWLSFAEENGKRMEDAASSTEPAIEEPDRFKYTYHLEKNELYWPERVGPEDIDRWFWPSFIWGNTRKEFPVSLKDINLLHPEDKAKIKVAYYGPFNVNHRTLTYINGRLIDEVLWGGQDEHIVDVEAAQDYLSANNTIAIEPRLEPGTEYDLLLPNYFEVEYWKNFIADNNILNFSYKSDNGGVTQFNVTGFTNPELELFDITDPLSVKYIQGFEVIYQPDGSYSLVFKYAFRPGEEKKFLALTKDKANVAFTVTFNYPSGLASKKNQADYIIISHRDFLDSLQPLKKLYNKKGLEVKIVDVEDIYDEFNYGLLSPYAIKDFLRFAYNKWKKPAPTYVLLVGDSHYDYKDYLGTGKISYVPAYLIPNTPYAGETASDNWFVCLDGPDDFLPDMFLGRIPVRNKGELDNIVQKILDYNNLAYADWNKIINLVADDEAIFEGISDELIKYLPSQIKAEKLYLAKYSQPSQLTQNLTSNLNRGVLLLNYAGHGAVNLWTEEELFNTQTIGSLNNSGRYPLVSSFTCLDGYFLGLEEKYESLAEVFLRKKDAGAIACFSPTGMGLPQGHKILDEELFKSIFVDGNYRLGLATTQAKLNLFSRAGMSFRDLIDTYILFGDPALRLKIEEKKPAIKETQLPKVKAESVSVTQAPRTVEPVQSLSSQQEPQDEFDRLIHGSIINYKESKDWKDSARASQEPLEEDFLKQAFLSENPEPSMPLPSLIEETKEVKPAENRAIKIPLALKKIENEKEQTSQVPTKKRGLDFKQPSLLKSESKSTNFLARLWKTISDFCKEIIKKAGTVLFKINP